MAQFRRQIQPARYVSQYDPAQEQLEMQAMLQRSQNFQESFGKLQEAEARQGSIFFLDPEARERTLGQFEERKNEILEKHAGDFEAAAPELTRLVTQEQRNPVYQMNKYQIQRADEERALKTKLGPKGIIKKEVAKNLYDPNTGKLRDISDFDYEIMERSDYDKELITNNQAIAQSLDQSGLLDSETKGFLFQQTKQGWDRLSDTQKENIIEASGKMLEAETTLPYDDKYNMSGEEYARQSLPRLFGSKSTKQYRQNPLYIARMKKRMEEGTPVNGSYQYSYNLVDDPNTIDAKSFKKSNENVRNLFQRFTKQDLDMMPVQDAYEAFQEGKMSLPELQVKYIEDKLKKKDPELQKLWKEATKTDQEIAEESGITDEEAKQHGFESAAQLLRTNPNRSEEQTRLMQGRTKAKQKYSNLLMEKAETYIEEGRLDKDFEIPMYQPNFNDEGVSTAWNAWSKNFSEGFTTSDQFTILTGDYAGEPVDDVAKEYQKEGTEFRATGVGGNDATGLVWEVTMPDGTTGLAKWNTSYDKQMSYLETFTDNPELKESLKADVLKIDRQSGQIGITMPDAPREVASAIQKHGMQAELDLDNPNRYYLKDDDGNYIKIKNGRITDTDNISDASALPKAVIFDTLQSLGTQKSD